MAEAMPCALIAANPLQFGYSKGIWHSCLFGKAMRMVSPSSAPTQPRKKGCSASPKNFTASCFNSTFVVRNLMAPIPLKSTASKNWSTVLYTTDQQTLNVPITPPSGQPPATMRPIPSFSSTVSRRCSVLDRALMLAAESFGFR